MFDKLKRTIGTIAAEEMADPESLRQEQLVSKLDGIAVSQGKLLAAIDAVYQLYAQVAEEYNVTIKSLTGIDNQRWADLGARLDLIVGIIGERDAVPAPRPKRKRAKK